MGHFKRNCPNRVDRSEALGRSSEHASSDPNITPQSTAAVGVAGETHQVTPQQHDVLKSLSDQQLEGILASRQCAKEQSLLEGSQVNVSTVQADGTTPAIGATLELDVTIEGVDVVAMVDTGAQSSIETFIPECQSCTVREQLPQGQPEGSAGKSWVFRGGGSGIQATEGFLCVL